MITFLSLIKIILSLKQTQKEIVLLQIVETIHDLFFVASINLIALILSEEIIGTYSFSAKRLTTLDSILSRIKLVVFLQIALDLFNLCIELGDGINSLSALCPLAMITKAKKQEQKHTPVFQRIVFDQKFQIQ